MSRSSCISHPENERLVLIRKWQLEACSQDACVAALLNLFEYWHNIKLEQKSQAKGHNDVAARHGENSTQIETLLQWHKAEQLESSLLNIFNKRRIQAAIELLKKLKFISVHRNPNPRYAFDKTKHFLFHPKEVRSWLHEYASKYKPSMDHNNSIDSDNLTLSMEAKDTSGDDKKDLSSAQNEPTIGANLTQQYTKITYQDDLPELLNQTHTDTSAGDISSSALFEIFWNQWVAATQKSLNKRKSFEIFSSLIKKDNPNFLLQQMLNALELQTREKELRLKFNLFIPQWPNPTTWLEEARWEDELCLDEAFYRAEQERRHSGARPNQQLINQKREEYLDGQYQSCLFGTQDDKPKLITSRQAAISQFNQEFRNRKGGGR